MERGVHIHTRPAELPITPAKPRYRHLAAGSAGGVLVRPPNCRESHIAGVALRRGSTSARRIGRPHQIREHSRSGSGDAILDGVPTIQVAGPYRMYFYSHEPNEPPHVHVDRDDQSAKFWLEPVALARNLGFGPAELRRVHRLVEDNRSFLLEKWHERFSA